MSESPLLQVRNIETFYGPVMAIRGISLDVHEGSGNSNIGFCYYCGGFCWPS